MDGLVDWYWLGVVIGLGLAGGAAAFAGRDDGRRSPLSLLLSGLLLAASGAVAVATVGWWAPAASFAAYLVGALSLRRLSRTAVAAAVGALVVLALVPVLGYLEALVVPLLGARLHRRAGARYAGLRVLARD